MLAQTLLESFGRKDIDSKDYRKAAAQRVGVKLPENLPLQFADPSEKYRKDLAARISRLHGVTAMKAELYGVEALDQRKAEELSKKRQAAAAPERA